MKRFGLFCLMLVCLLVSVPLQASASVIDQESVRTEKVKLKLTYANVKIAENQYFIRSETDDSAKVEVFDSETGELVQHQSLNCG